MLRHLLSLVGCGGLLPCTLPPGFAFLFKLAWESKVRLPLLIAVAFMLTDYHLQLEINVDVHITEEPLPVVGGPNNSVDENDGVAEVDILFEGIIAEDFDDENDETEENSNVESEDDDDYDDDDDLSIDTVDIILAGLELQMENLAEVDSAAQQT